MDKQLKTKWLKALRSGRYKQGMGCLKNVNGEYCCLGVLARIQGARFNAEGEPIIKGEAAGSPVGPISFLKTAFAGGLAYKTQNNLANMNDGAAKFSHKGQASFEEIAKYISKHL